MPIRYRESLKEEKELSQAKLGDPYLNLAASVLMAATKEASEGNEDAVDFLRSPAGQLFFDALGMDPHAGMNWLVKGMPGRKRLFKATKFENQKGEKQMTDQPEPQKGANALKQLNDTINTLDDTQLQHFMSELGEVLPSIVERVKQRAETAPQRQAQSRLRQAYEAELAKVAGNFDQVVKLKDKYRNAGLDIF